jgi:death-on-curing protein
VSPWRWISESVVLAIHDEQLAEHGGGAGVRDMRLLQSALARPRHLASYGSPDLAALAASYASGIAKNHPFIDGNKRTAFIVANVFLLDHGYEIATGDAEIVTTVTALAAGKLDEAGFAEWLRRVMAPNPA